MDGFSFADSLTDAAAPEHHTRQYFEVMGGRGMYDDGWWLSMRMPRLSWDMTPTTLAQFAPGVWDPDADPVELYYLPDDFSQAHDLAAQQPEKVAELRELFWSEAEKHHVLPLGAPYSMFFGMVPPLSAKTTFEFRDGVQNVMPGMIPRIYNRSYSITAHLTIPDDGAEGVIVAEADHLGGFAVFIRDNKLCHTYSAMGVHEYRQQSEQRLPTGDITSAWTSPQIPPAPKPAVTSPSGSVTPSSALVGWHTQSRNGSPPTPGSTSAGTTAASSTAAMKTEPPTHSPESSTRSSSTSTHTSTSMTRQLWKSTPHTAT